MLMTTKEIKQAIRSGHVVVLRDDPASHVCEDFFAGLVVVSMKAGVPTRLATLSLTNEELLLRTTNFTN